MFNVHPTISTTDISRSILSVSDTKLKDKRHIVSRGRCSIEIYDFVETVITRTIGTYCNNSEGDEDQLVKSWLIDYFYRVATVCRIEQKRGFFSRSSLCLKIRKID